MRSRYTKRKRAQEDFEEGESGEMYVSRVEEYRVSFDLFYTTLDEQWECEAWSEHANWIGVGDTGTGYDVDPEGAIMEAVNDCCPHCEIEDRGNLDDIVRQAEEWYDEHEEELTARRGRYKVLSTRRSRRR